MDEALIHSAIHSFIAYFWKLFFFFLIHSFRNLTLLLSLLEVFKVKYLSLRLKAFVFSIFWYFVLLF